ncbi:MAG: hypothetical protein IJY58_04555 [Alphaproteobacteria bacterium]|nr:hypothetical protein [Alphaproteobacteria bacterium]
MRFIVFFNDHPKVMNFDIRAWDNATQHPNFRGEMTHNLFIKHFRFNPDNVFLLGDIIYNQTTKQWEIDTKRPLVSLCQNKEQQQELVQFVQQTIQQKFAHNHEAIRQSLWEQEQIRQQQIQKHFETLVR